MDEKGWSLTSMLVFCTILLLGFFSAIVVAKKNLGFLFDDANQINLTNSIDNITIEISNEERIKEDVIDYTIYEDEIKTAAVDYFEDNKVKDTIINVNDLINLSYIKEIHDPKNYSNICRGYVIYKNNEYYPYLRCIGSYATEGYNLDYEI